MSCLFNISRVFLAAQEGDVYLIHNIIWQQIMYTKKRGDTTKHYPIKNINIPWIHFSTPFEIFSCFSMLECKSNTLTKRFGGGTNELLFFNKPYNETKNVWSFLVVFYKIFSFKDLTYVFTWIGNSQFIYDLIKCINIKRKIR